MVFSDQLAARRPLVNPLVSIIVPCYNAAPWLAETLESALAQTWSNKEILLINDGSTDDSRAIAQNFSARGVQIIDQLNQGASAARNHGLRLARGEFIQFLDADDLLSPDKITRQIETLGSRPSGTLASCAWGRFTTDVSQAQFVDETVFRDFSPIEFLVLAAATGGMMHPSAWLVPRSLIKAAGPWNESLSLNDDGEYFCRVLLASTGVTFCADSRARSYYRSRLDGSLSQQRNEKARRSQFHSIELMTTQLLAAEESSRTRQAAANYYQRFIHDFFPAPKDLIQAASSAVVRFGGSSIETPPMGSRTRQLASIIGWKNVWRLKHWLHR